MPAEAVRFSVSLSQKRCTRLEALNAAALRVVCSIPSGHMLHRPAAGKSHSEEQSVLCSPTLYSWCLFFSVDFQGGCAVLFDCSHCFTVAVPTTLAPFHGECFGFPHPSGASLLLKTMPPAPSWFLFWSGFTYVGRELLPTAPRACLLNSRKWGLSFVGSLGFTPWDLLFPC